MLNTVCVLTVQVRNLEEAIEFYTEVLGFEVNKQYGDTIVSLKHNHIPVILEQSDYLKKNQENYVLLGIQSNNLDEDIDYLKEKGVDVLFDPRPCPPGRFTVVKDPSGNQIELLEFSN